MQNTLFVGDALPVGKYGCAVEDYPWAKCGCTVRDRLSMVVQ